MKAKNLALVASLTAMTALTACTTTNGYNGYNTATTSPAVQGAIAGAAIGALAKSDGNRTDIGKAAAIGAAAGAAGGYVLGNTTTYPR